MAKARGAKVERNMVLGLGGVVLLCVVAFAMFGPTVNDSDRTPTTYNSGSHGLKAAYLLSGELGYDARRWDGGTADLGQLDAARTTLVLTSPVLPVKSLKATQDEVAKFLQRGGRVVATGETGAALLPNGTTAAPTGPFTTLCFTRPEGAGPLAHAGKVSIADTARWTSNGPEFHVEQRCGKDAVVVRYPYGAGEAVWWSSSMPMSNAGLSEDASLSLMLSSLGPTQVGDKPRTVLFDEYLHEARESVNDLLAGLPWWPLAGQSAAVAALLVLSRGRRNGPLRLPVSVPRTSPLEFADSMGRLYRKARATAAPVDAARTQTLRYLRDGCGLSHDLVRQQPVVIAEALTARIGGDWKQLAEHLEAAQHVEERAPTSALALKLVQALEADQRALAVQVSAARGKQAG